jgi:Protein of unknown function (DUF5672)
VMLCAVTGVAQDETIAALRACTRSVQFGDAVLLSQTAPPSRADEKFRWERIEPISSKEAYSHFICVQLHKFVTRPHVLLVQWDGFIIDPGAWNKIFLEYDYIGAPWPWFDDAYAVGNGGFSIRSRRLLEVVAKDYGPGHPEDLTICRDWRESLETKHGLSFAPVDIAAKFARERHAGGEVAFGFHGLFLYPSVLSAEALRERLDTIDSGLLVSRDAADLLLELVRNKQWRLALRLYARRMQQGHISLSNLALLFRLAWEAIWGIVRR